MEKIIEIDIKKEEHLYEKYNKKEISKDLIKYIIEKTTSFNKDDKVKVIINNNLKEDCSILIKESLKQEYDKCLLKYHRNNLLQLTYLFFGILILFLSTTIESVIFKEVVLIGGWVLIWEMLQLEMFSDTNIRKTRKILKKLLSSEFIENKES